MAQNASPGFHYLSPEEGLSQASNNYIYHDSKGFVWLSSIDGLNRFDGKTVKVYKSISGDSTSLSGNIITSNFYEDEQANIWFTTYEGIHCYLRKNDHFRHFQVQDEHASLRTEDYHAFHLDQQGQLWVRVGIGPAAQLYLFDIRQDSFRALCTIDGQYNFPILDEQGAVSQVVSCNFNASRGISILDTRAPFGLGTAFTGQSNTPATEVAHLTPLDRDTWFLGTSIGLIRFNPNTADYQVFASYQDQQIGRVNSSLRVNDTILWVASSQQGILLFNLQEEQFVGRIPSDNPKRLGLRLRIPNQLYKDHQGNVWVSSFSSGVNYTNLRKRKFGEVGAVKGQKVTAIFESSSGDVFCSYGRGQVAYFPNNGPLSSLKPTILPTLSGKQSILFFFEDQQDGLWAVTINRLLRWDKVQLKFIAVQNLPSYTLYVYTLRDRRILLATYSGVYELRLSDGKAVCAPFQELGQYQQVLATSVYESQDAQLYLAVDAARVLVLQKQQAEYVLSRQIEGVGYAKDYYEGDRFLWMATSTGLLKVDRRSGTSVLLNEVEAGIPNENYYCIIPDESGSFWLSGNRGLIRYFPQEKRVHRYTLLDGLQALEYNTNAFLKTRTGEIWLGGTGGLNRFRPEDIQALPYLPKIQITRLQVNDETFETDQQIGELQALTLDYYQNTLSFDFVALAYGDPANNRLQYQLENYDMGWVDARNNGFARYSNLPPGGYSFKVKAANADGVWNEQPRVLHIVILKPWWQTWWFYVFSLVTVAAFTYKVVRYRLEQALKIERLRVKISSDLHDDVGSTLAGLTMQADMLAYTASPDRQSKLLRISELSRNAMSQMRDTVWAIDARKDKFKNILDRIREHAAETLELKSIQFHLEIVDVSLDKKMSTQIRQNVYLICKEAITNTAKHSDGDNLIITFRQYGRKGMQVIIQDNGSTANEVMSTSGLGLSNLHLRAKEIGAKLETNTSKGFQIRLTIGQLENKGR